MELIPDGATYRTREHEFLKLNAPDAHLTDVIEDRDGSLLVLDTGGWFRIGCPSSLTAKPEIPGAIYRIRRTGQPQTEIAAPPLAQIVPKSEEELLAALASASPKARLAACEEVAKRRLAGVKFAKALLAMLAQPLEIDRAICADLRILGFESIGDLLAQPRAPLTLRFGPEIGRRIDQALGDLAEPIKSIRPTELIEARLAVAEPEPLRAISANSWCSFANVSTNSSSAPVVST